MSPRRTFWLLLALAALNGLVFVFLVPPWQHYDEPNHFEYLWLAAHRPGWPQKGDFDRSMRAATLQSMIDHGFFRGMEGVPSPEAEQPWIGPVPQTGSAPLYYALASLPLRFFPPLAILPQLYAARLFSWLLFLGTVALAWATSGLLFPEDHPLRWMTPAFLAGLPAFADVMTAVNDDAAAVALAALFIYSATRLLKRGRDAVVLFGLLSSALLALATKSTVFFAPLLTPLVLVFALWPEGRRRRAWGVVLFLLGAGLAAVLRPGDAALWYRRTPQRETTRVAASSAPLGRYALRLRAGNDDPRRQLLQLLPSESLPALAGRKVTLGAWLWASAPVEVAAPRLYLIGKGALPPARDAARLALDTRPRFYAWTIDVPPDAPRRAWVQIGPLAADPAVPVDVFADGLVLAAGEFPLEAPPQWEDAAGRRVLWGGARVDNLLRNPSGERAWLGARPWVDTVWEALFGYSGQNYASLALYTLRDWPGAGWYYRTAAASLFRTFWARFGWGHVPLTGHKPYRLLLGLSLLLLLGGLGSALAARRALAWEVVFLYALVVAVSWGLALTRGAHHVLSAWINIPVARYTFPGLFPLAVGFAAGGHAWESLLSGRLPFLRRWPGALWGLFLTGLTLWGWWSVYLFYFRG